MNHGSARLRAIEKLAYVITKRKSGFPYPWKPNLSFRSDLVDDVRKNFRSRNARFVELVRRRISGIVHNEQDAESNEISTWPADASCASDALTEHRTRDGSRSRRSPAVLPFSLSATHSSFSTHTPSSVIHVSSRVYTHGRYREQRRHSDWNGIAAPHAGATKRERERESQI